MVAAPEDPRADATRGDLVQTAGSLTCLRARGDPTTAHRKCEKLLNYHQSQ